MNKYKLILIFLMMLNVGKAFGQDIFDLEIAELKKRYPIPTLTKVEMYSDFDTLISIIERCNAQYLVRKKVTGYNMIAEMKKLRNNIDKIDNTIEFIRLLKSILTLTLDEHCFIGSNVWWYRYDFYEDDVKINNITDREFGINFQYQDSVFYVNSPEINLFYAFDKYFLKNNTIFYNDNDSIAMPLGTEVISFNDYPIITYQDSAMNRSSRWDFNKKKYYNSILYSTWENNICFNIHDKKVAYSFTNLEEKEKEWNSFKESEFHIKWFAKDSVLYFRIPRMSYSEDKMQQFQHEVLQYRSHPIKSIIIDIRGNYGGNDQAWKELLSIITKEPIAYPFCLISNDDRDVLKRFTPQVKKNVIFNFIDSKHQFSIFEEEIDTIIPKTENLGYEKNIFVLVNEDIYSSAMGLASLCTKTNRIKTVGMPTGKLGGQGVEAKAFILPHSRLLFVLDILLDASCVANPEDFYHDHVDYLVTPSIEYYKYWYNPEKPYSIDEKAMYEYDEVFKKALDIIKKDNKN